MQKNITIILAGASLLIACQGKMPDKSLYTEISVIDSAVKGQFMQDSIKEWQEIEFVKEGIIEKMAYADTANFMHQNIYGCARCYLRPEVAKALSEAGKMAAKENLRLVIFDCYRPLVYQQKMFDIVKNPDYVAIPGKGSMHNKGQAVDIGLANKNGESLDFGNGFDDFSEKSHYLSNKISVQAKANRRKLNEIMTQAGFEAYSKEWWHFNYTHVKYPVSNFIWNCY